MTVDKRSKHRELTGKKVAHFQQNIEVFIRAVEA